MDPLKRLRAGARSWIERLSGSTVGRVALAALVALVAAVLLDHFFPPPLAALERPASLRVDDRTGEPLRLFLAADERWRLPVGLDEVPDDLVRALVAIEDRRYYLHPGVDPIALARAVWSNLRAGEVVSGASTLPMQVARMLRREPRTLSAKLREALWALQLERRFSKAELLGHYLDLAPYGGNLEGVGAASLFYFGKPPERLSLAEIALLVALPRSPSALDPARDPEAARRARDRVLRRLGELGVFSAERIAAALTAPVPTGRRPVPFAAPHFSLHAAATAGRPAGAGESLLTTLDRDLQRAAERTVGARIGELRAAGIGDAAAVVLELGGDRRRGRSVRAWVGSPDFFDGERSGQVDGVVARRSPGSTLKPILYLLALDRGELVPDSFLLDIPTDFSGYVAENYDGRYRGRVTVRRALVESLNAPAVRLLARLGLDDFLALLRRAGVESLDRPAGHYGLPLVLGAGEASLLELTNLYAGLAEGAVHRPPRLLQTRASDEPSRRSPGAAIEGGAAAADRFAGAAAAAHVVRLLTGLERPDLPGSWDLTRDSPQVAWKTGTSYGHRDAWAIGVSGRYAIGVWVGNFDGTPVLGISGAEHAGPLLFDLFRAIGDRSRPVLAREPEVAHEIAVCAVSRHLPTAYCPRRIDVETLPGHTRLPRCAVHRRVFVDSDTGELLTGGCLAGRSYRARVLELEPAELRAWRLARGEPVEAQPALARSCGGPPAAPPPRIVSPDGSTPYRIRSDAPASHQRIPLIARAAPYARRLFWYVDGRLAASGAPGETLFLEPVPGRHRLILVDDTGRSDRAAFRVEGVADGVPADARIE